MTILEATRKALFANELDSNPNYLYRFSDPDGIRTGKSGYSFGLVQYDIMNNPVAEKCLKECGFTAQEIDRLKKQNTASVRDLEKKLRANSHIVDRYDNMQVAECVNHVRKHSDRLGVLFDSDEAFVHLADYHNQFYLSPNGKCMNFIAGLRHSVRPEDIKHFKLSLPWGQKRPDDVLRRYNNIKIIFNSKK